MKSGDCFQTGCFVSLAAVAIAAGSMSGCGKAGKPDDVTTPALDTPAGGVARAEAELDAASGSKVHGTVSFYPDAAGVRVVAAITGLTPGKHGFHIHEKGDCTAPDAASAGPHFNPSGAQHGDPDSEAKHAGDLGNIEADAKGEAHYTHIVHGLAFEGTNSIIDRAVVVHGDPDDLVSQPAGKSGPRVACGVIKRK